MGIQVKPGRIKRIIVNRHVIRANRRGGDDPPLTVHMSDRSYQGHEVEVNGPSRVTYRPDKPLSCGATVWIETTAPVMVTTYTHDARSSEASTVVIP